MEYDNRAENLGAEQSVIGSMLIEPKTVGLVVEELTEDDFLMELNREIFRAFRSLFLAERVMDPVTILDMVGHGEAAIRQYILQLMDTTPTAANIREYIRLTRKNARRMKLAAIGKQLQELTDPEDGLALLKAGEDLLSQDGRDDEADMERSMLDFYADFERKPEYLPWGLPFLDRELMAERKDFVVLAGRPSDGKTALALHMAYTQAATKRVGFFSLETGRKRLFSRLVSSVSEVRNADIKRRRLGQREYDLIAKGAEKLIPRKLTLVEASGWTVEQIEARSMARRFDVVYIDYLQLIRANERRWRGNRTDEVSDISRALANMARRHGITVVALSQLSRLDGKSQERREPVMQDLRESGQIEQDADIILFIWRKEENRSNAQRYITLAKNKEGMLGLWPVGFQGATQSFEVADEDQIGMDDLPDGW